MSYVTRGNVQVELKTGTKGKIYIRIHPVQGYAVKHDKEDWIVFISINDDPKVQSLGAVAFKRTQRFTTTTEFFAQSLIDTALKQTVIEIKITDAEAEKARSPSSSPLDPIEIEFIKIPATLGSET